MNSIKKNVFQVNSSGGSGEGIEQNRKKTHVVTFGKGKVEEGIGINGDRKNKRKILFIIAEFVSKSVL